MFHREMISYFITQRLKANASVVLALPILHAAKSCYSA